MDIIITDMTGHSFTIKLNWDICIMKQDISHYYEKKILNKYLIINNISHKEFYEHINCRYKWLESEDYKRIDNYYCANIELIYNGEKIEQYHVECDLLTEEMIEENNNMIVVITKKDDSDNNSIYSNESD